MNPVITRTRMERLRIELAPGEAGSNIDRLSAKSIIGSIAQVSYRDIRVMLHTGKSHLQAIILFEMTISTRYSGIDIHTPPPVA